MKKLLIPFAFLIILSPACIKDNPKQLTKDLVRGGKWDISTFRMQEYNNPTGWQEEIVLDTLFMDPGYMEFFDDEGAFGPTYRKGNFKFQAEEIIPFDWDAYGPPSSDEVPVMYFIFSKPWNDFRQNYEHSASVPVWEENKIELRFDLGNLGVNNNHVIYTFVLKK